MPQLLGFELIETWEWWGLAGTIDAWQIGACKWLPVATPLNLARIVSRLLIKALLELLQQDWCSLLLCSARRWQWRRQRLCVPVPTGSAGLPESTVAWYHRVACGCQPQYCLHTQTVCCVDGWLGAWSVTSA